MKPAIWKAWAIALFCLTSLFAVNANAANEFAEAKVVLQISDPNPFKQTLVLNVANNLVKHYGPDRVAIEIVAFGPGLRLLFADNANTDRIQSLVGNGVKFSACSNTTANMGKKLGHPPKLNKNAVTVSAGVVRILDLQKQGYSLIKP
ncbi:DsrE family protein [Thiohalophilus sp.]|uniref:DsrE family protein n=1 Tax=Thiohalophilus sp. TaxID=3028392 RepID=UPI002ACDAA40|nr:DsrE family protein [Thiohalophilus sp.]MDZ7661235.1 DsrE family protein [Thiohalophilus sp.]